MENSKQNHLENKGFDSLKARNNLKCEVTTSQPLSISIIGIEATSLVNEDDVSKAQRPAHSISISMPPSPVGSHVPLSVVDQTTAGNDNFNSVYYSQPMSKGGRNHRMIGRRFDSFKTWSGNSNDSYQTYVVDIKTSPNNNHLTSILKSKTYPWIATLMHWKDPNWTLYGGLPTNLTLPKELHPVFFLFVAAPSVASMAWTRIQGSFDCGSRIAYFIALFLYVSLAVRVDFFRGFRFSLAWWAYTFPMTAAAVATIKYSNAVTTMATKTLALILCLVATLTVTAMLVTTIIHAFVLRDLFPNDIAIAIAERRPKTTRKWYHMKSSSSDSSIEQYLKYANSDDKDIENSVSLAKGLEP